MINPSKNQFDGVVHSMASQYGTEEPEKVGAFNGKPIAGFEGLKEVARAFLEEDEDLPQMLAFLSLVEWASTTSGRIAGSGREGIVSAIRNLERLGLPKSDAIVRDLKDTVMATQMVLGARAKGLEKVVGSKILQHVVQNFVWKVLVCDVVAECLEE